MFVLVGKAKVRFKLVSKWKLFVYKMFSKVNFEITTKLVQILFRPIQFFQKQKNVTCIKYFLNQIWWQLKLI